MSNESAKPSLFTIYKSGQGKWLRWGTVAGSAIVVGAGAIWVYAVELVYIVGQISPSAPVSPLWKAVAAAVWILFWGAVTFWFVNTPKWAEFLIMTESEMRKVTWPSRREVINSVKIVILLTGILGVLLWMVDLGFIDLFQRIGIA